jgi:hypothetical protein
MFGRQTAAKVIVILAVKLACFLRTILRAQILNTEQERKFPNNRHVPPFFSFSPGAKEQKNVDQSVIGGD